MEKTYNKEEIAEKLSKSMYKAVKKALNNKKDDAKKIVEDILDPNYVAEVDPDEVPSGKTSAINKKEKDKLLKIRKENGLYRLKLFLEKKK